MTEVSTETGRRLPGDPATGHLTSVDAGLGAALRAGLAGAVPVETGEPATSGVPIA